MHTRLYTYTHSTKVTERERDREREIGVDLLYIVACLHCRKEYNKKRFVLLSVLMLSQHSLRQERRNNPHAKLSFRSLRLRVIKSQLTHTSPA